MYRRRRVFLQNCEHSERRNRDRAFARMPLPLRPRVAAARQGREAACLPEVQEPTLGHSKDWAQAVAVWNPVPSSGRRESEGSNECLIRSL